MTTLTLYGAVPMTDVNAFDHAAQVPGATSSLYRWTTAGGRTIAAYSAADDFTFTATAPLGGTVQAMTGYDGAVLAYTVVGLSVPLTSLALPWAVDNRDGYWRPILAGETSIVLSGATGGGAGDFVYVRTGETLVGAHDVVDWIGGASGLQFAGDAITVEAGGALTGGADMFILRGSFGTVAGDAIAVSGQFQGGNDTIVLNGGGDSLARLVGDANTVSAGDASTVKGGNDLIRIVATGSANNLFGDFGRVDAGAKGGNDTVDAAAGLGGINYIAGDADQLGGVLVGGNDAITGPVTTQAFLYGDVAEFFSNATLTGGNDTVTGGDGNDTIYGEGARGAGATDVAITGGNDLLRGGDGNDTILGQSGDDTLDGGLGNDALDGCDPAMVDFGRDTIAFDSVASQVFVDLAGGVALGQGVDSILGFENVRGSALDDTIAGDVNENVLAGGAGNDRLYGRGGYDTLDGGDGNDTLTGGDGNDTYLNIANDTIVESDGAGGGIDTVQSGKSVSLAAIANVERATLTGTAAANATGNTLANVLTGNAGNNLLDGREGDDTLNGQAGADTLIGGAGRDQINPGNDAQVDIVRVTAVTHSTGPLRDVVIGMDLGEDRFDLPVIPVAVAATVTTGALNSASFNADLAAAVNAAALPAGQAVLFDPGAGNLDQPGMVYLVVDANGIAGYQANADYVFQLQTPIGTLDPTDFV